jgi:hypothetical protein
MSRENWLWGTPSIHGELLKLGFEVAESTVSMLTVSSARVVGNIFFSANMLLSRVG